MIGLLQRVGAASVVVAGRKIAEIGRGLLVFVAAEREDGGAEAARLAQRVLGYRVFPDDAGRMNLSVREIGGDLLVVPQFTLAADTAKGTRPGFSAAAEPARGETLFRRFVDELRREDPAVETGRFGAHMQVTLTNDGPVTFWLRAAPRAGEHRAGPDG